MPSCGKSRGRGSEELGCTMRFSVRKPFAVHNGGRGDDADGDGDDAAERWCWRW